MSDHGAVNEHLVREWHPEHSRPLTPVFIVVIAVMVGMAVFWVGFMLAPAAVLLVGYLALTAGDRAHRQRLLTLRPPVKNDPASTDDASTDHASTDKEVQR